MEIVCLDLEGVLVPEIWPAFAAKTGIKEFELTTRNIPDYDELMRMRVNLLNQHNLKLNDITEVIKTLTPLDGAQEFVLWLKQNFQLVILSDTFYQFSYGLMLQLDLPTLLCHKLIIDDQHNIVDYKLRQANHKRQAVVAFKSLYYQVFAAGDSYNDTAMLAEADKGILFNAPNNVIAEFPEFTAVNTYADLKQQFIKASGRLILC